MEYDMYYTTLLTKILTDFCNLPITFKYYIGAELELVVSTDQYLDHDELETKIWNGVQKNKKFDEFSLMVEHYSNRSM